MGRTQRCGDGGRVAAEPATDWGQRQLNTVQSVLSSAPAVPESEMTFKRLRLSHIVSIGFLIAVLLFFTATTLVAASPLISSVDVRPHVSAHGAANTSDQVEPI